MKKQMNEQERREYQKRCRAPFTDAYGRNNVPKHPREVDASYLQKMNDITAKIPEAHRQGFIQLHRKIFGMKILKTDHEL